MFQFTLKWNLICFRNDQRLWDRFANYGIIKLWEKKITIDNTIELFGKQLFLQIFNIRLTVPKI